MQPSTMTDEQIKITIAKACGWDVDPPETHNWSTRGQWCVRPNDKHRTIKGKKSLPDYLNDLNAMHEAEKMLKVSQYDDFVSFLLPLGMQELYSKYGLEGITEIEPRLLVSPSARQRAIAFIKAVTFIKDIT